MASSDIRTYIKKYVAIDGNFVDDFFGQYDLHTNPNGFVVDLAIAAKWLRTTKGNLKKTLIKTYAHGIDYEITKPFSGRGTGKQEHVLLTPDCFKALCMMSRTEKAKDVRNYYIAAEKSLIMYRNNVMQQLTTRVAQLENNQRGHASRPRRQGVIYVVRASSTLTDMYKIGRTVWAHHRLRSHNRALADDLETVYTYETDCVEDVEVCMKRMLRKLQYRRRKEVYQIDIASLKKVISGCNSACINAVYRARSGATKQDGGYYAVVLPR
ncbi:hypothetical protein TSOC_012073 [Tetrabaena socialis]|uniref:MSV199 domain-containing protein n=1 Tax=Tetrabaena socialis TaxID=47790 RepID=A0A2J7ZP04_9CHLO|nr:hypothetical protein TSOC_012073 [Tetrabaena socialis]|eukprot:PNH01992.1 hypothetical protein TSOC_012073 [Tetrabaena socialis]